ncbi:MAG: hypothetical protein WAT81_03025 [Candidatus Moraniibacteriota bacterium]
MLTNVFRTTTLLSLAGVLFAGYLSVTKIISGACPFREPCVFFLGYPTCWYGLGLFTLLFLASLAGLMGRADTRWFIRFVAVLGVLFAGTFVSREILSAFRYGWPQYTLLLPTCAYGLVFYILVFVAAHRSLSRTADDQLITS